MGLCGWIVFGFFAGLVGRALMPGEQKMGFVSTTLLGVAGAFVGGTTASLIRGEPLQGLHASGFIGAVIGSILLLVGARALSGRKG